MAKASNYCTKEDAKDSNSSAKDITLSTKNSTKTPRKNAKDSGMHNSLKRGARNTKKILVSPRPRGRSWGGSAGHLDDRLT